MKLQPTNTKLKPLIGGAQIKQHIIQMESISCFDKNTSSSAHTIPTTKCDNSNDNVQQEVVDHSSGNITAMEAAMGMQSMTASLALNSSRKRETLPGKMFSMPMDNGTHLNTVIEQGHACIPILHYDNTSTNYQ